MLSIFKLSKFAAASSPFSLSSVEVKNLNMSTASSGTLNSFSLIAMDSVSAVSLKTVKLSMIESASSGMVAQCPSCSAGATASSLLSAESLTATNLISRAGENGGLIDLPSQSSSVQISASEITSNYAAKNLLASGQGMVLTLSTVQFTGNTAKSGGSLGLFRRGTITILDSTLEGNKVYAGAALIQLEYDAKLNMTNTDVKDNQASDKAHGILVQPQQSISASAYQAPELTISNSRFDHTNPPAER